MNFFMRMRFDTTVQAKYAAAGLQMGENISYLYSGDTIDAAQLADWRTWEAEYARRGYRTISLDKFTSADYSIDNIRGLLGIKREPSETPILHAERFIAKYNGRERTEAIDLDARMNEDRTIAHGNFTTPSTEEPTDPQ